MSWVLVIALRSKVFPSIVYAINTPPLLTGFFVVVVFSGDGWRQSTMDFILIDFDESNSSTDVVATDAC